MAGISREAVSPLEVGLTQQFDGGSTFPPEETENAKIETKMSETGTEAGSVVLRAPLVPTYPNLFMLLRAKDG
jgi:hypothetical protein